MPDIQSPDDLKKLLSLTLDDAFRVALEHTHDKVLDEIWYQAISDRLGVAESQIFTMGLSTYGISVNTPTMAPPPIPEVPPPSALPTELVQDIPQYAPDVTIPVEVTSPPMELVPIGTPEYTTFDDLNGLNPSSLPVIMRDLQAAATKLLNKPMKRRKPISDQYKHKVKDQLNKAMHGRGHAKTASASTNRFVSIAGHRFKFDTATTPQQKLQGMQVHSSIEDDYAMWFPQVPSGSVRIHMAGTKFPLDIIFVQATEEPGVFEVQADASNVQPGDRRVFGVGPVDGVLEVKGGFVEKYGIQQGDLVIFE